MQYVQIITDNSVSKHVIIYHVKILLTGGLRNSPTEEAGVSYDKHPTSLEDMAVNIDEFRNQLLLAFFAVLVWSALKMILFKLLVGFSTCLALSTGPCFKQ